MAQIERVLIVGGGIGGLTLGRALHQRGLRAELVERSPGWQSIGAAFQLHGNGMRIMHALGLGEAVEQAGRVIRRWKHCEQDGEVLFETDLEELWGEIGPCIAIDRPRLQKILVAGAAAVPCLLGIAVASLSQHEQRVQVGFSDGSTRDYDLVVGADGISSTVRQLLMGSVHTGYTGAMVWRIIVPVPPPDPANFNIMLGDGCFFGITPMGDGQTNVFGAVEMPRTHDPVLGRLERLRRRFAGFGGQVQECLAAISGDEQIHCGPIEEMQLDHWHRGRVVLIGDATHAGAPTMAQAGIMAMEDAYVLAEALRGGETVEKALESYELRRKPRAAWVQQRSRLILESYLVPPSLRGPALRERGNQLLHDSFAPLIREP